MTNLIKLTKIVLGYTTIVPKFQFLLVLNVPHHIPAMFEQFKMVYHTPVVAAAPNLAKSLQIIQKS